MAPKRSHQSKMKVPVALLSLLLTGAIGPSHSAEQHTTLQCSPPKEAQCLLEHEASNSVPETARNKADNDSNKGGSRPLNLCVGIRGNGSRMFAHFPALARIVEELGSIDAAVGGSSASVSTFILENIQSNSMIANAPCGDGDDRIRRARASFLLKSVEAMGGHVDIINPFTEAAHQALEEIKAAGILERLLASDETAFVDLMAILEDGRYVDLINPELLYLLLDASPDPLLHAYNVIEAVTAMSGEWAVNSPAFFVRPTPFNLNYALRNLDAIGSFYMGFEPLDTEKFEYMLDQCAMAGYGKEWIEANETITDSGKPCGVIFDELVEEFMANRNVADGHPSRLDSTLGTDSMVSMIVAAVLRDRGIVVHDRAKAAFFSADLNLTWDMNFDDVHIGYWGSETILEKGRQGITAFGDLKSAKADFIGQSTWKDMLVRSPAEPGLSNGIPGTDTNGKEFVSLGGWPDLVPAQVLSAIGCSKVVLITRPSGAGKFQTTTEIALGASKEDLAQLNDLDMETSGWNVALDTADAVMCGDYDTVRGARGLSSIGWIGPIVSEDQCITGLFDDATDGMLRDKKKRACSGLQVKTDTMQTDDRPPPQDDSSSAFLLDRAHAVFLASTSILLISFNAVL